MFCGVFEFLSQLSEFGDAFRKQLLFIFAFQPEFPEFGEESSQRLFRFAGRCRLMNLFGETGEIFRMGLPSGFMLVESVFEKFLREFSERVLRLRGVLCPGWGGGTLLSGKGSELPLRI